MGSKIYVGGLLYSATEQELSDLFGRHGAVASARIRLRRNVFRCGSEAAITALNGAEMNGWSLTVNEARPQEPRTSSGGGGRGGVGGGKRDRW